MWPTFEWKITSTQSYDTRIFLAIHDLNNGRVCDKMRKVSMARENNISTTERSLFHNQCLAFYAIGLAIIGPLPIGKSNI